MTKKFEKFLLGLLWLLTITLATTFWMNIKYGFNIFSAAHWAYLSELQAYRTQIKTDFYISIIAAIVIGLIGLYVLARPPRPRGDTQPKPTTKVPEQPIAQTASHETKTVPESVSTQKTELPHPDLSSARPLPPSGAHAAPPRIQVQQTAPVATSHFTAPNIKQQKPQHLDEISDIFQNAGYVIKKCNRIGNLIEPVVALSYDQKLWIGTSNVSASDAMDAVQTLLAVFADTLGDSANDMSVYACILNATDEPEDRDIISTFNTIDELKRFVDAHPNTKPEDYDQELFDAVSTYIDTVINYIGK